MRFKKAPLKTSIWLPQWRQSCKVCGRLRANFRQILTHKIITHRYLRHSGNVGEFLKP
jgi:hypothetical protein